MIRFRADAVFTVYDGFTGKALPPSAVRVLLDGEPYRPEYRQGGHLVFINLEPGYHVIKLSASYYQDEVLDFESGLGERVERALGLKPGDKYPFGAEHRRLAINVLANGKPYAQKRVLLAAESGIDIKIAQDSVQAGSLELKLYLRSGRSGINLPGEYLIIDGKNSETCILSSVADGDARLAAPLQNEHKRGKALYPCQAYATDENGELIAYFKHLSGIHAFFSDDSKMISRELAAGENEIEIKL